MDERNKEISFYNFYLFLYETVVPFFSVVLRLLTRVPCSSHLFHFIVSIYFFSRNYRDILYIAVKNEEVRERARDGESELWLTRGDNQLLSVHCHRPNETLFRTCSIPTL